MAARRFPRLRAAALSLALAGPALADDASAKQRVADQRAEAQVREGVKNADLYARTSAAEGVKALRGLLAALDLDGSVSGEKRLALVKEIQDKIAGLEAGRCRPPPTAGWPG